MASQQVPIGVVADRYGLPATTLRYWEDVGLLPPQQRSGGQRRYDQDALRRVMFIRMAKQSGLSLNAIRALLAGNDQHGPTFDDWAQVARQQLEVIDQRVNELNDLKAAIEECLACGCQQPQRCRLLTLPLVDWCTD
ncbi:MAG TPA: MerR family transcriptional regulator [Streptosporangiaceae bacterium]|nr:MerR family transcriptional regulator [Streptosporangiaceae bacterium]